MIFFLKLFEYSFKIETEFQNFTLILTDPPPCSVQLRVGAPGDGLRSGHVRPAGAADGHPGRR